MEVLSQPKLWLTPLKNDQAVYLRNPDGSFKVGVVGWQWLTLID